VGDSIIKDPQNWLYQIILLSIFILLFGTTSVMLGQDANWDILGYHYYNGYAFIHHRLGQDIAPALMQSYLNPFFDVINYLLISIQKPKVTGFLLGAFSGITCFFLYQIAIILFASTSFYQRTAYALFSLIIGTTGAANISLLGTTTNDSKMSLLVMAALYLLLKSILEIERKQLLYTMLSALVIGLAVGFKLPAACYAVGLFAGLLFSRKWNKRHIFLCVVFGTFVLSGFLLANGYWMVFLYKNFQNPLYPYYNNIFHSSFAPYISFNILPIHSTLHSFYQFLLLPFYLAVSRNTQTSEAVLQDMRLAVVFFILMIFILKLCVDKYLLKKPFDFDASNRCWFLVFTYFLVSYGVWLITFSVYRYALPLELVSGLLIVFMVKTILKPEWRQEAFLTALFFILMGTTCYPDWGRIKFGKFYFEMSVPSLPPNTIVMMTTHPLAYVIPFFPADTRFIGMPFVDFEEDRAVLDRRQSDSHGRLLLDVMSEIMHSSKQVPVYTLAFQQSDDGDKKALKVLAHFGLVQDKSRCVLFKTNMKDTLKLCPMKHIQSYPI